jgi:hypothetical protein
MWSFSIRGMSLDGRAAALRVLSERGTLPIEPLPGCEAHVDVCRWAYGNVGILLGVLGGLRQVVAPNVPGFVDEAFVGVNIAGPCGWPERVRKPALAGGERCASKRSFGSVVSLRCRGASAARSTCGESHGVLEWMASALTSVGVASCRRRNVRLK